MGDDNELMEKIESLTKELAALAPKDNKQLTALEFEKDVDENHHIDFITACSNLRCINYTLETAPRHKVKMIAGKIIPALATTTAMITGLVTIEMLKWALGFRDIENYRNSYCNLGISQVLNQVEPTPAKKKERKWDPAMQEWTYPVPDGWSSWDKINIKGDSST